jgi:hypothetical protein
VLSSIELDFFIQKINELIKFQINFMQKGDKEMIIARRFREQKISAKRVPHRIRKGQKQRRVATRHDFIQTCQGIPTFIYCIFVSNETGFWMKTIRRKWSRTNMFLWKSSLILPKTLLFCGHHEEM